MLEYIIMIITGWSIGATAIAPFISGEFATNVYIRVCAVSAFVGWISLVSMGIIG